MELRSRGGTLLLDLWDSDSFTNAHIEGAINIGAGSGLSGWAGSLLDPEREVVLITDGGQDETSRRALLHVGFDRIAGVLSGGMEGWIETGLNFIRSPQLSVGEARGAR